ncbi:MAG: C40 family peptidase [Cytophagaceae bacterium]|nr:C40 family peptidase [Cytophagaceae bacterium]
MSDYGICNISIAPVRMEPSDKAELGTQLLFGDAFTILKKSQDEHWLYIQIAYDNYLGWIDYKQYKSISKDFFDLVGNTDFPLSKELIGLVKGEKTFFPILYGTSLPFYKNGTIILENEVFKLEGAVLYPKKSNDFKFLEKIASFYLHSPYMWGGKSHFGIDCSGFVQQVYKFAGHKLPRDAYQQAQIGKSIQFKDVQPGDLAYFVNEQGKVMHVGIILEKGRIIHASGKVRIDMLDEKGIFNAEMQDYSHKLHSIKRLFA